MISVRPAEPEDAEVVARFAQALSLSDGGRPSRFTAEIYRRDGFGERPAFHALIAEIGGEPVGYALYYPGYDTDRATRGVYLADLYIMERFRRRGVGRILMQAVAKACRSDGGGWMFWSVLKRNRAGRRFYRTMAPELKDVVVCAALGASFERLSDGDG
jgi:GNAT superfamily N-acetyltransferase